MKLHIVDGIMNCLERILLNQHDWHLMECMSLLLEACNFLMSLINDEQVSHIAVAFDSSIKSFRNQIFPNYKDGSDTPDELLTQFPLAERVVEALELNVGHLYYEADDTLGSAAIKFSQLEHVDQVVICSVDKDLCQIVLGENCMFRQKKQENY